jgi:hypothetical protein
MAYMPLVLPPAVQSRALPPSRLPLAPPSPPPSLLFGPCFPPGGRDPTRAVASSAAYPHRSKRAPWLRPCEHTRFVALSRRARASSASRLREGAGEHCRRASLRRGRAPPLSPRERVAALRLVRARDLVAAPSSSPPAGRASFCLGGVDGRPAWRTIS